MRSTQCRRLLASVMLGVGLAMPWLSACQICFPIPKESAADLLIAADLVVLAREDPDEPFSLRPVEVLKGGDDVPSMDLFLDSPTRRLLRVREEVRLVCVYQADGPEAGWRRIGVTDDLFEPLVREILARAPAWTDALDQRLKFFSGYLGHEDRQVRDLAHIEVARAPYRDIKTLGGSVPREELHAFLGNVRYAEWHALYILLLAQTGVDEDHRHIADRVQSAERFSSRSSWRHGPRHGSRWTKMPPWNSSSRAI